MSAEYDSQTSANELVKFNSQFEAYAKEDNTFFDVITASNLAYNVNKENKWDSKNGVEVKLYLDDSPKASYSILIVEALKKNHFFEGEGSDINKQKYMYDDEFIQFTKTEVDKTELETSFRGIVNYSDITGKVDQIEFRKN